MTVSDNSKKPSFFYEGIAIAIFTGLSYLFAYSYERGYCSYYNIPQEFISISVTNVLVVAVTLIGFIAPLWIWGGHSSSLMKAAFKDKQKPVGRALILITNAFIVFYLIIAFNIFGLSLITSKWGFGIAILLNFLMFLIYGILIFITIFSKKPFFYKYILQLFLEKDFRKKALLKIFEAEVKIDNEWLDTRKKDDSKKLGFFSSDFWEDVRSSLPEDYRWLAGWGLFTLLGLNSIIYFSGYGKAMNETKFLIPLDYSNYAILRSYDGSFIAAEFDIKSKEISNNFMYINKNKNYYLNLKYENIGKLKPKKFKAKE